MSARSTLVVAACGLALVAAVGVYEQRAVASGQWTASKQWSSIAPWMPVATIANPPVPLADELAEAERVGSLGTGADSTTEPTEAAVTPEPTATETAGTTDDASVTSTSTGTSTKAAAQSTATATTGTRK